MSEWNAKDFLPNHTFSCKFFGYLCNAGMYPQEFLNFLVNGVTEYMKKLKIFLVGMFILTSVLVNLSTVAPPVNTVRAQSEGETLALSGLQAPVTVIYDSYGVPHIYAENSHDLFMAQGYVHAVDRFWQMEWWRRFSSGRQAEIAGADYVGFDSFIRTLGFQQAAERDFAAASDEAKAALEAYAEGVNAYIAGKAPEALATEFAILADMGVSVEVGEWTPFDTLRWYKMMALNLAGNFELEIERAIIAEGAGALARIAVPYLVPDFPFAQFPVIIEPGSIDYTGMTETSSTLTPPDFSAVSFNLVGEITLEELSLLGGDPSIGSNSWVIGGSMTDTGTPLLANDPHLGIQNPSIWYEVGLHCTPKSEACPYDVVGVTFAGSPGIVIGHTDRVAWGFTNVGTDAQDLYLLQINPDNPNQYMLDGNWVDFEIFPETLNVYGADPRQFERKWSVWGPVITDIVDNMGPDVVAALRWTAYEESSLVDALLGLNRATDWESFRAAAALFDGPAQNMIYADVDGNIGYQMPGLTPIRAEGHDPRYPVDGSLSSNTWQGYVPFEELPSLYNPEAGYIVTANNSVVGADYPYYITADWDYGYRAVRIEMMIQNDEDGIITADDIKRIQNDNYNLKADFLIPALQTLTFDDETLTNAVVWLGEWDRQNSIESGQAALFEAYWSKLLEAIFADDFGVIPSGGDRWWFIVNQMIANPRNPVASQLLGGDINEIMVNAFVAAYAQMVEMQGEDPTQWSWGSLHTANFIADPLGYMDEYAETFNVTVQANGGDSIVNATSWGAPDFAVASLPSMRQILDPGNWDNSQRINTLGQSGDPASPHYADQVEMWRDGTYRLEPFTRVAVESTATRTLTLIPAE